VATWDSATETYLPEGSSTWDLVANTVTFRIPRQYLATARITTPYDVSSQASVEPATRLVAVDDRAPDSGAVGVAGDPLPEPAPAEPAEPAPPGQPRTITLEHDGGNTFTPLDSTLGARSLVLDDTHHFDLAVTEPSDVELLLTWDDPGASDLDLYVTGAAESGSGGATSGHPESLVLEDVQGALDVQVDPYLVAAPTTTYTLTRRPVPGPARARSGGLPGP
jgi:hypothetical protein